MYIPEVPAGVADPVQALVDDLLHLHGSLHQLCVLVAFLLKSINTFFLNPSFVNRRYIIQTMSPKKLNKGTLK
jgi:hypothetical protein